jgi:hypothetical protein
MIQLLAVHRLDSPVMLTVFALYVSACLLPCRARPTSAIREFSMQHNVSPARPSTMQCYMHNKFNNITHFILVATRQQAFAAAKTVSRR